MVQLSSIDYLSPFTIAGVLFLVLIVSYVIGYRIRATRIKKNRAILNEELGSISSAMLGLLALILAFSFSMANSRFDTRRSLALDEANTIGTVFLRTEFFPDSIQSGIKSSLKEYLEQRIAFFEAGLDLEKMILHYDQADQHSKAIWNQVTDFAKIDPTLVKTSEIIPALNTMIDLTTSRRAMGEANIPTSIQWFLIILCIASTFLLGYERKNAFDWIIVIGFSLLLSLTVFSIFDLDRPRAGMVTLDEANSKIKDLRSLFE